MSACKNTTFLFSIFLFLYFFFLFIAESKFKWKVTSIQQRSTLYLQETIKYGILVIFYRMQLALFFAMLFEFYSIAKVIVCLIVARCFYFCFSLLLLSLLTASKRLSLITNFFMMPRDIYANTIIDTGSEKCKHNLLTKPGCFIIA